MRGRRRRAGTGTRPAASSPSPTPAPSLQQIQLASTPRRVRALGGALADADTMQLLWSRELNTERPMGSITKVMTALVVIDSFKVFDDMASSKEELVRVEAS